MAAESSSTATVGWQARWSAGVAGSDRASARPAPRADLADADDRALVDAFRAGRDEAFEIIVERHQRRVYQLCYRFARDPEEAADLAQDVFVRAFKGLRRFKGQAALGTWLYRVGVNTCLNKVAARRPPTETLDQDRHVDTGAASPFDRVAHGERATELRQAIRRLPPRQRAVLVLRVYQELPHAEIAEILGSSVGAVKANFFHALANLRRALRPS
jgi:RNA polymerase sigma-70 factor (ECF subfamily)